MSENKTNGNISASNELEATIKDLYKTEEEFDKYISRGRELFQDFHTCGERIAMLMLTPPWRSVVPADSVIKAPEDSQPIPAQYVWVVPILKPVTGECVFQVPAFGFNTLFGCTQLLAVSESDLIASTSMKTFKSLAFGKKPNAQ